uniref:Uncharacterized protein n=1 Tax=Romanomermis culicivorax TaxID=13658 RepID=A0A915JV42_ROMCU
MKPAAFQNGKSATTETILGTIFLSVIKHLQQRKCKGGQPNFNPPLTTNISVKTLLEYSSVGRTSNPDTHIGHTICQSRTGDKARHSLGAKVRRGAKMALHQKDTIKAFQFEMIDAAVEVCGNGASACDQTVAAQDDATLDDDEAEEAPVDDGGISNDVR